MKIKIGIIGLGRIGIQHAERLYHLPQYDIVGSYDIDENQSKKAAELFDIKIFSDVDDLINSSDAIGIFTPANTHVAYTEKVIKAGKHIFIEKPFAENLSDAERLYALSREANIVVQIGHVERFNPVFQSIKDLPLEPMFIECHRLAPFDPRGTDVSVILDLMIHDIDIVLKLVKKSIKNIAANGVAVISKTPDIANARLEFDNGCVANLTASRVSMTKMRKMRIFQKSAYISLDFLNHQANKITLHDEFHQGIPLKIDETTKYVYQEQMEVEEIDAMKSEWLAFSDSILLKKPVIVSIEDALKTAEVAERILHKIQKNGYFV